MDAYHSFLPDQDHSDLLRATPEEHAQVDEQIRLIPLSLIEPMPLQPRRNFPAEEMEKLRDSIRIGNASGAGVAGTGIEQPVTVRPLPAGSSSKARYQIVMGERRFRAAGMAGLREIPCIIRDLNAQDAFAAAVVENLQRHDLDPLEEAHSFAFLMKQGGLSIRAVAEILGVSKSYVENRINLLKITDERILELILDHPQAMTFAHVVNRLQDEGRKSRLIRSAKQNPERMNGFLTAAREALREEKQQDHREDIEAGEAPPQAPQFDPARLLDTAIGQIQAAADGASSAVIPRERWQQQLRPKAREISSLLDRLARLCGGPENEL